MATYRLRHSDHEGLPAKWFRAHHFRHDRLNYYLPQFDKLPLDVRMHRKRQLVFTITPKISSEAVLLFTGSVPKKAVHEVFFAALPPVRSSGGVAGGGGGGGGIVTE